MNKSTGITIGGRVFHRFFLFKRGRPRFRCSTDHAGAGQQSHKMAVNTAATRARQASSITAPKYLLSFSAVVCSRLGGAGCACFGKSPTNRRLTARSSNGSDRAMGNRAIIGASVSAASAFGKAASRAASSQGSIPSRVNAEMTLSGIPFCSSPTEAKRKSFRSEWSSENRAANIMIARAQIKRTGPARTAPGQGTGRRWA